jgi:hypothetical protein
VISLFTGTGAATAQIYDHPSFNTPYGETGTGVYLVIVNDINDFGGMATFRKAGDVDLGLRASVNEVSGGDVALNGGVDISSQFVEVSDEFPLDVGWVTGFGFGWATGDGSFGILRIPGGVSLARKFRSDDGKWALTPYATPRLALDIGVGGSNTDTRLHFDVDFGLDMQFGASWMLRFGLTVGSNSAMGFGITF